MRKKIGILTFHRSINNGAFMQSYSLSKALQTRFDADVEIINYDNKKIDRRYKKEIVKSRPFNIRSIYKRLNTYVAFRSVLKSLPLSDFCIIDNEFEKLFECLQKEYDLLIVGSDAVWNWVSRGFPNPYWLNFDFHGKLYSYAASAHGMDISKATVEQLAYCKEALNRFEFIGVRDGNTEKFVKMIDENLTPVHTCDPTIFLDMEDIPCDMKKLKEKLMKKHKISFERPVIGLMSPNAEIGKIVRDRYGDKYDIVSVFKDNKYADYYLYDLTPYEWSRVFSLFELTFSEFFHGTLLSLKNLTPVVAIDVWKLAEGAVAKLEDVLGRLGLEECYFKLAELNEEKINEIYNIADKFLENPPKEYIKSALSNEADTANCFFDAIKRELK